MKLTKRLSVLFMAVVMCVMCTACFDEESSSGDKRGDLGKLEALTPYGSTVITGIQLEHQAMWRDDPEIEKIVQDHGFSEISECYEFELNEWFEVYIKSSTRDTFTSYIVKYEDGKDYKSITEDEIKHSCIDKSLEDQYPDESNYGDLGGMKVEKEKGGSTGTYALVFFRFGKPEAMIKFRVVPSTAPSASDVLKELEKQK
ncbi:MAG: hypothetical protein J5956_10580 [Ruminococcus sp.]|nr:hypothetical protein [Ruminococcus sp.]